MNALAVTSSLLHTRDLAATPLTVMPLMPPGAATFAIEQPSMFALEGTTEPPSEDSLRSSARQLVASSFIVPILQQVREARMAAGPFAPGAAEKRFGPLLDARIADEIAGATSFGLVDQIVKQYTRSRALPAPVEPAPIMPLETVA